MQFTRLRLSGFKSFVEPVELDILPGMTGIVGPNGCGKSNLTEALRWAMGETSAKKMRGSEMDDVIFGGTDQRPARNVAEVGLYLDNADRTGTAEFNDTDELVITRRIERGGGSDYRINGKAVRQRDVQLVFADQATGAHSTSIVSQGQVGALVSARPQDRRLILEEAAGITGLHSRRHEAELRLKAAENNLGRVEDVLKTMDSQLQSLRRQSKQAARYRALSEQIRKTEAAVLHLRWVAGQDNLAAAEAAFAGAERAVRDLMLVVTRETAERASQAAALPPLRQDEATAAVAVQRLVIARETLDGEMNRIAEAVAATGRQKDQALADRTREEDLSRDAAAALSRLREETAEIQARLSDWRGALPATQAELDTINAFVRERETTLTEATEAAASADAERGALSRRETELAARASSQKRRLDEQTAQRDALKRELDGAVGLAEVEQKISDAEADLNMRRRGVEDAEQAREDSGRVLAAEREKLLAARGAVAKLKAETEALSEILKQGDALFTPLIDRISVEPGFEAALAAALGEALTAALEDGAPVRWQELTPLADAPTLPQGCEPLASYIKGPKALDRALALIGLVADDAAGAALAHDLRAGQILVSREGSAWRWDGLTVRADAPTAAAIRLKQRNRLDEIRGAVAEAEAAQQTAGAAVQAAETALADSVRAEKTARDDQRQCFAVLDQARAAHAKISQQQAVLSSRLTGIDESIATVRQDSAATEQQIEETAAAIQSLPDGEGLRARAADARAALAEQRTRQAEAQSRLDGTKRDIHQGETRLGAIAGEIESWTGRAGGTGARINEISERIVVLESELAALADKPAEIAEERARLMDKLSDAEATRRAAADRLVAAESTLGRVEQQLRADEQALGQAREDRVRAEAAVAAAQSEIKTVVERIAERLECLPEAALEIAGFAPGDQLPEADRLEKDLARQTTEREAMGPVNLRAEVEAAETAEVIAKIETERDDLVGAIAKLRSAIAALNKEARERLAEAFTKVDAWFQELFVRLFGGGRAHLQLTESEDALEAGLEIYASPPGKKMQVLSLLSGGEKALTATALLFAVFMTNPAPICVLDEVDAPMDEANVGRFCDLVEDIARRSKTRFIIVTHHRLTMARMDRLFGVTMQERGISQLVSVNIAEAEATLEKSAA